MSTFLRYLRYISTFFTVSTVYNTTAVVPSTERVRAYETQQSQTIATTCTGPGGKKNARDGIEIAYIPRDQFRLERDFQSCTGSGLKKMHGTWSGSRTALRDRFGRERGFQNATGSRDSSVSCGVPRHFHIPRISLIDTNCPGIQRPSILVEAQRSL